MPFTPAHPAILLLLKPFKNLQLSWTALLIGSIIPDFEYFIWMSPSAYVSHTILGIFIFNLPMTFVMAFLWHQLLAPVYLKRFNFIHSRIQLEKIPAFSEWIKKNWMVFFVSAFIGIVSHLVWDSFSHADGYLVHRIPYLMDTVHLGSFPIRRCYLMWYISTIFGLITLFYWYIDIKKMYSMESFKAFFQGEAFWSKILFLAGLIGVARVAMGLGWNWMRHLVMVSFGSLFYASIIVAWLEKRKSIK